MSGTEAARGRPADRISVGLIGPTCDRAAVGRTFRSAGFSVLEFESDGGSPGEPAACPPPAPAGSVRLSEPAALVVCTPVTLTPARGADTRALAATARAIAGRLRRGQLVLLAAPVPPGTTRELLLPPLVATGLTPGRDFFLACGPPVERGSRRVVGGLDESGTRHATDLFGHAGVPATPVSSPEAAEVCGALAPTLAAVRAAAINELKIACDRTGVDAWEVLAAAGEHALGPTHDGSSLESQLLAWGTRRWGASFRLLEAAAAISAAMPACVVSKVADALNDAGKAVKGSRVAILGATSEAAVDVTHESPTLELMSRLARKGAVVSYNDPRAPSLPRPRRPDAESIPSQALTAEYLAAQDCVLIVTDHDTYDYEFIVGHSRLVVDIRNAARRVAGGRGRVVRV